MAALIHTIKSRGCKPVITVALFILVSSLYGVACTRKLETRYDSGQLNEKFEVMKDAAGTYIKHGRYASWYENGKQKQEGTFKDDKKDGKHTFWYENGDWQSARWQARPPRSCLHRNRAKSCTKKSARKAMS